MLLAIGIVAAAPVAAQERDYCPERPGLDTPACIVDEGHVSVETGLIDWTLDRQSDARTDTILIDDILVRYGVTDRVEARVGWTPYGHQRMRDVASGTIDRANRVGDVSLGVKASLRNPDGDGFSIAVLPYATLPVGRTPIGAGTWGAGLLLPVTYDLSDTVQLDATPEVDAEPNEDGSGRHLRYSTAGGATFKLARNWAVATEGQVIRDEEAGDRSTQLLAALSLAWQPQSNLQLDLFGIAGLNRAAPDVELQVGVSRRF